MLSKGKKFISPEAWFSLVYPQNWNEFEDSEGTFLFYNPDSWNGNFRISAYKAGPQVKDYINYGQNSIREELRHNDTAAVTKLGAWECAYSKETFQEGNEYYTTHIWITGVDNISFECSFTVSKGSDKQPAEDIIATLEARKEGREYPLEVIPLRILEINLINEAFDSLSSAIKQQQKKDVTGTEEDIPKLQTLLESGSLNLKKRDSWYSVGLAFGVVLENEIDGMQWVTVVDSQRETPALRFGESELILYPHLTFWQKARAGQTVNLARELEEIKEKVITILSKQGND